MALLVVDRGCIDCPIHAENRTCRQIILQQSSFPDQSETEPILDQGSHLGWMRCSRVFLDRDPGITEQFQKSGMSVGMALRVVEDREIVLQIRRLDRSFCGERIILAKTYDKSVAP
jgi:hypothetical protein